jgi:hypothetical protein
VVAGPEVWLGCGAVTVTDVVTLTVRAGEHVLTPQVLGEDDITVAGAEGVGIPMTYLIAEPIKTGDLGQ